VVAELSVARGAEGIEGDIDPSCARPVRLRLAVRVPQVTALKMELSRVTGSAGSALVRSGRRVPARSAAVRPWRPGAHAKR
jgi:hypothetical protein